VPYRVHPFLGTKGGLHIHNRCRLWIALHVYTTKAR
jgi:hypothetical protein